MASGKKQPLRIPFQYSRLIQQIGEFDILLEKIINQEESSKSTLFDTAKGRNFLQQLRQGDYSSTDAPPLDVAFNVYPIQIKVDTPDTWIDPTALYDIARLEEYGFSSSGYSFLERLTKETPIALHWLEIDTCNAPGCYEMQLISPEGKRFLVEPQNLFSLKNGGRIPIQKELEEPRNTDDPLKTALETAIDTYLKKNPSGKLFVHRLGEALDLERYYTYIPQPQGYLSVKEQTRSWLSIPDEQRRNVQALLEYEKQSLGKRSKYHQLYGYKHETIDTACFYVFVDGQCYGFNNIRGMAGLIRSAKKEHPEKSILVHRGGSHLDFNLVDTLLEAQVDHNSLYLARSGRRKPYVEKVFIMEN